MKRSDQMKNACDDKRRGKYGARGNLKKDESDRWVKVEKRKDDQHQEQKIEQHKKVVIWCTTFRPPMTKHYGHQSQLSKVMKNMKIYEIRKLRGVPAYEQAA